MSNPRALLRASRIGAGVLLTCALILPKVAVAQRADVISPPDLQDRYIVSFPPGFGPLERAEAVRRAGAAPLVDLGLIHAIAVRIPGANVLAAVRAIPGVIRVVPDRPIFALQSPVSGRRGLRPTPGGGNGQETGDSETVPAGVKRVGEPATGAEGAGVGVVIGDTGIDWTHPDLRLAAERFDAFGGDCMDRNGHGTHVAGTVAALKNGSGVVGVAPGATLYCGKVLGDNGAGSDSNIISLLEWVANRNAQGTSPPILVVNLSLGREKRQEDADGPLRQAIQALYNAGVTVVVAAGNDSFIEAKDQVPSGFPEVIAVASTTAEDGYASQCPFIDGRIPADTASYFTTDGAFDSTTGIGVSVSAPGGTRENVSFLCRIVCEGILSTAIGGGTTKTLEGSPACGTSMAAPHVSGLAARMIQEGISGPESVRTRLRLNSDRQGTGPLDSRSGAYTFDGEREGIAVWRQ